MEFLNFQKSNSVGGKFLKIPSFINFPCGHVRSHPKFGTDWFSRFDVHWIQTDKQRDRQAKYIDRCIKFTLKTKIINSAL